MVWGPAKGDRMQVSLIRVTWFVFFILIHAGSLGCVLDRLLKWAMQALLLKRSYLAFNIQPEQLFQEI